VIYKDIEVYVETKIKQLVTNKESPVRIVHKHIKYIEYYAQVSKNFFKQRVISFDFEVLGKKLLDGCMERIKDEDYLISEERLKLIQKDYKIGIVDCDKAMVEALVFEFLMLAITEAENEFIQFKYKYEIEVDTDDHTAIPEYILFNAKTGKVLLVSIGRNLDIEQALLYNFDQMRSFAMSSDGKDLKYIYGLSTVGNKWVFCCYVVPKNRKRVTYQNFMVSRVFVNDIMNGMVTKDFLEMMIRYTRGFLVKSIDAILDEAYEIEVRERLKRFIGW